MAIARLESPPPPSGGRDSSALGLSRDRPERELLALSRGGVLSPQQVQATQRRFLVEAITELAAEVGYAHTSANEVIRRAKVSRRTFYDLFNNLDECFLAALLAGHDRLLQAARVGYAAYRDQPWETRLHASVAETLALLDAQPALAELCIVQALAGPRATHAAHHDLIARLASDLSRTAQQSGPRPAVPEGVADALVSGAWMTIHQRLAHPAQSRASLSALTGQLTYTLCAPFTGAAAASRELHRPLPPAVNDWTDQPALPATHVRRHAEAAGDGSRKQVLRYLAAHPGASNRMVGEHLGTNESTTSRRLARLAKDGLIVSPKRGTRRAWHVTEQGRGTLMADPFVMH